MTDLSFNETGPFEYDAESDEHRSGSLAVPLLGHDDAEIVLVGYAEDPTPSEFHMVVRNLLALTRETLHAVSLDLLRYCDDINDVCEPEDEVHVDVPNDLWNHVELGRVVYIQRRNHGDRKLYATLECECEWEQEHGLQLVLREGLAITKLGPYDGHLSNADSYDDSSLESVVYR